MSFRRLENHARLYYRRLLRNVPGVRSRETAVFHEQIFVLTWKEVVRAGDGEVQNG